MTCKTPGRPAEAEDARNSEHGLTATEGPARAAASSNSPKDQWKRSGSTASGRPPNGFRRASRLVRGYFKILAARAITSPRIMREQTDCTVMASLPQRASGITSVGLNAVASVKPR